MRVTEMTEHGPKWTTALRVNDIDILVNRGSSQVLIVWPWFKQPHEIRSSVERAKSMGYHTIVETGNYQGYRMKNVDTQDFDYMLMEQ